MELGVDARSVRQEEGTSRAVGIKEEELLRLTDRPVVALLELLEVRQVVLELLGGRERHAIHALQRIVLGVREPIGARVLVCVRASRM